MIAAPRAALLVLFTLVVGRAIAYPLLERQWEWLG